jgi:hypothetical protein
MTATKLVDVEPQTGRGQDGVPERIVAPHAAKRGPGALVFAIALLIAVAAGVLVAGLNRADEPTVGTVTGDVGPSRAWMADLIRAAEDDGFAVAGLSPTSARFIPVTQHAARAIRDGVGSQTLDERKPAGYGQSFRELPPPESVLGQPPESVLGKPPDSPRV